MNIGKYFFSLIVFLQFSFIMSSQTSVIDSLKRVLDTIADEKKAEIYNEISSSYKFTNIDSSLFYAQKAVVASKKNNSPYQKAVAYKNIGHCFIDKMKKDSSILYFNKALDIFKILDKKEKIIHTYVEIAHLYANNSEYDESYKTLLKALKISEKNNIIQGLINVNNGIGMVLRKAENYNDALIYLNKALSLEKNKDKPNNRIISNILSNIGMCYYSLNEYDQALKYFLNSQKEYFNEKDFYRQMTDNNYLALVYSAKGNHTKALKYYKKALIYAKKSNLDYLIAAALQNIGQELHSLKRYNESIQITKQSLIITKKNRVSDWEKEEYHTLYLNYDSLNDKNNALFYFKRYHVLNDSLKKEETKLKVANLKTKYETEKKDKQIKLLAKDNDIKTLKLKKNKTLTYFSWAIAFLILVGALIYLRLYRQRQKAREIIQKQESELKFTENLRNYYKLANMLPLIVFFVDENKKINYINDKGLELIGLTKDDFNKGLSIPDLMKSGEKETFLNDIDYVFENHHISEKQYSLVTTDGKKKYFIEFLSPNIEHGKVTGILGVLIDVTKMREMQKEIQTTAIDTENKERKRFSADLHDGLGPLLSSIKLFISGMESGSEEEKADMTKYIKELIDDSIRSVRTISNNILPVKLTEKGLLDAIRSFSNKLSSSKEINIIINSGINTDKRFDSGTEAILFRVIQELINNTLKHAEAKKIKISFDILDDWLNIHYTDDGKGFDVENTLASNKGLGLKNIINRIEILGGKVNILSNNKEGTTVDIWVEI